MGSLSLKIAPFRSFREIRNKTEIKRAYWQALLENLLKLNFCKEANKNIIKQIDISLKLGKSS